MDENFNNNFDNNENPNQQPNYTQQNNYSNNLQPDYTQQNDYSNNQQYNQQYGQYNQQYGQQYNQQYAQYGQQGYSQQYPAYVESQDDSNGMGVASLVMGIISLVCCSSFIFSVLGIVFGIISLSRKKTNNGIAVAGVVLSAVSIIIGIVIICVLFATGAYADLINDIYNDPYFYY